MTTNPQLVGEFKTSPSVSVYEDVTRQLIIDGRLSEYDLDQALAAYAENNITRLPFFLVRSGLISERDLADAEARALNLPLLGEDDFPEFPIENNKLAIKFLKSTTVLPLDEKDDRIVIAMADPTDTFSIQAIALACNKHLEIKIATISQIENAINRLYGEGQSSLAGIVEEIEHTDAGYEIDSIQKLKDLAGEAPIVRLVNLIINHAIESRASDIHIEPFENRLKVRYRIDGVLQEAEAPPARSTAAVISRVKIMAKMNIAERRLPQDGRIQLAQPGQAH